MFVYIKMQMANHMFGAYTYLPHYQFKQLVLK